MKTKKVLKITPILITLNLLVLFTIVGFYTARLIKYYLLENGETADTTVYLVDEIKKKRSYLDETKGLVYKEDTDEYVYKGEVNDNYLSYSGLIYRILGIDKNGNIKAVSEHNVTLIYPGFDKGYKDSYVNKWLNFQEGVKYSGKFEEALVNSKSLLVNNLYCSDVIDDVSNITCDEETEDYKITLLSLYDYKESGGKSGFLNNGDSYNLGTLSKDNLNYFVTEEGEITIHTRKTTPITLKPVITIANTTELISGNGKEDSPYVIEEHEISILADTDIGNYVKAGDITFRVVEKYEDKIRLITDDILYEGEDKPLEIAFGGSNNRYTTSNKVGSYLNNDFLKDFKFKDDIVLSNFYTGMMSLDDLDYSTIRSDFVEAKVGLPSIGDLFINDTYNILTTLRGVEESKLINVINSKGIFFADEITSEYNVKAILSLRYDLVIESGDGSEESPFILGVSNEGKEKEE